MTKTTVSIYQTNGEKVSFDNEQADSVWMQFLENEQWLFADVFYKSSSTKTTIAVNASEITDIHYSVYE